MYLYHGSKSGVEPHKFFTIFSLNGRHKLSILWVCALERVERIRQDSLGNSKSKS